MWCRFFSFLLFLFFWLVIYGNWLAPSYIIAIFALIGWLSCSSNMLFLIPLAVCVTRSRLKNVFISIVSWHQPATRWWFHHHSIHPQIDWNISQFLRSIYHFYCVEINVRSHLNPHQLRFAPHSLTFMRDQRSRNISWLPFTLSSSGHMCRALKKTHKSFFRGEKYLANWDWFLVSDVISVEFIQHSFHAFQCRETRT